jgi:hypothetical protein
MTVRVTAAASATLHTPPTAQPVVECRDQQLGCFPLAAVTPASMRSRAYTSAATGG